MAPSDGLSSRDRAVLAAVFGGAGTVLPDVDADGAAPAEDAPPGSDAEREAAALDAAAVAAAEDGRPADALALLDRAVATCPDNASALNDRAQVLSLLGRTDEAAADVERAIAIASEGRDLSAIDSPKSVSRPRTLARALCQRARTALAADPPREDDARRDLDAAGRLGDGGARAAAARLNPYAKLCAQMVSELLSCSRSG